MPFDERFLNNLAIERELTDNETIVFLDLFGKGKSRQEIENSRYMSMTAITSCLTGIYRKFNISGSGPGKESRLRDELLRLERIYSLGENILNIKDYLSEEQKRLIKNYLIQSISLKNIAKKLNIDQVDNETNENLAAKVFDFLYQTYIRDKNGNIQSQLIIFLKDFIDNEESLSDKNKNLLQQLIQRSNQIIQLNNPRTTQEVESINIPIVIAAMNKREAEEFYTRYDQQDLTPKDLEYIEVLHDNKLTNWLEHYDENSEKWKPFFPDYRNKSEKKKSIKELIEIAFDHVGSSNEIELEFIDIRDYTVSGINKQKEDFNNQQLEKFNSIRHYQSILIIDAISMQYDDFRGRLIEAKLEAFPSTWVVYIRPFLEPIQQIIDVIDQNLDREFCNRFSVIDDIMCEKVNDQIEFRRWFKAHANYFIVENNSQRESNVPWNNFGAKVVLD